MVRLALPLALLAPLVLAACGGGGGSGSEQAASDAPCPEDAVRIEMKDIAFEPQTATVDVGQKVCWVNDDDVNHDAVAESGADFHSALYGKGRTFTTTITKAGTVSYVCTVHPNMTGTLQVKP